MFSFQIKHAMLALLTTSGIALHANSPQEISSSGYFGSCYDTSCCCSDEASYFMHLWPCMLVYGSVEAGYKRFNTPVFNEGTLLATGGIPIGDFPPFHNKHYADGPYVSIMLGCELPLCCNVCWLGNHTRVEI